MLAITHHGAADLTAQLGAHLIVLPSSTTLVTPSGAKAMNSGCLSGGRHRRHMKTAKRAGIGALGGAAVGAFVGGGKGAGIGAAAGAGGGFLYDRHKRHQRRFASCYVAVLSALLISRMPAIAEARPAR